MKTKKLIIFFLFVLMGKDLIAQIPQCTCTIPATLDMYVPTETINKRKEMFYGTLHKGSYIPTMGQYIDIDKNVFQNIYNLISHESAAGLRINFGVYKNIGLHSDYYFPHEANARLALIFSPTAKATPGLDDVYGKDMPNKSATFNLNKKNNALEALTETEKTAWVDEYSKTSKLNSFNSNEMNPNKPPKYPETSSIWYSVDHFKNTLDFINDGCLKDCIKQIRIQWVAYCDGENEPNGKPVGRQLSLVFILLDSNGPIDIPAKFAGQKKLFDGFDTGIPCPPICPDTKKIIR